MISKNLWNPKADGHRIFEDCVWNSLSKISTPFQKDKNHYSYSLIQSWLFYQRFFMVILFIPFSGSHFYPLKTRIGLLFFFTNKIETSFKHRKSRYRCILYSNENSLKFWFNIFFKVNFDVLMVHDWTIKCSCC